MTPEDFISEAKVPPRRQPGWGSGGGGTEYAMIWDSENDGENPYPASADFAYVDLGGGNGSVGVAGSFVGDTGPSVCVFVGPDAAEISMRWRAFLGGEEGSYVTRMRQFAQILRGGQEHP